MKERRADKVLKYLMIISLTISPHHEKRALDLLSAFNAGGDTRAIAPETKTGGRDVEVAKMMIWSGR